MAHLKLTPREWQDTAFKKWETNPSNEYHGTIDAVTGSGKSMVGHMAIVDYFHNNNKKIFVIVKTEALQKQWQKEIIEKTDITESDIGIIGGGKYEDNNRVIIAIINSLRRKIVNEGLLVLDECHNYQSEENVKFIDRSSFERILALSATPKRSDGKDSLLLDNLAPIIYQYGFEQAKKDGTVCDFKIVNIGVEFTPQESILYNEKDEYIKANFKKFGFNLSNVIMNTSHPNPTTRFTAQNLMKCIASRKKIIFESENKLERLIKLLKERTSTTPEDKYIIFCEQINTSNSIYKRIQQEIKNGLKIGKPERFNSKMKPELKNSAIDKFKNNETNVLLAVKALDEGLDVPDTNIGIIYTGSGVGRQFIQRLGRPLRQKEGKTAVLYQLYVQNTKDYDWLVSRMGIHKKSLEHIIEWIE